MKFFKKSELKIIFVILLSISFLYVINIKASLRKGRDITRKDDISYVQKALNTYYQKHKVYPLSDNSGRILGCFNDAPLFDEKTGFAINAVACDWGRSSFEDITLMPRDPKSKDGMEYKYVSDGSSYKFYVSLEGKKEPEYNEQTISLNLQCGTKICNYGRGDKELKIEFYFLKTDKKLLHLSSF